MLTWRRYNYVAKEILGNGSLIRTRVWFLSFSFFMKLYSRLYKLNLLLWSICQVMMPSSKPGQSGNALSCWWAGARKIEMDQSETRERGVRTVPNVPMQLPDCPVCWEGFDDGPRMPRLLHCGHTICQVSKIHEVEISVHSQMCLKMPISIPKFWS